MLPAAIYYHPSGLVEFIMTTVETTVETTLNCQPSSMADEQLRSSSPNTTSTSIEISVVIPTYKARGCLSALHERLTTALTKIGKNHEIIFVEDGCPDDSWSKLKELADADEKVVAYKLSKNFGQQMAITAGLSKARGNWTVVMDCDLQDPPEVIERLYKRAKEGFDIVFAMRKQRTHSRMRLLASKLYFAVVNLFGQTQVGGKYGGFSIISREVKDAYLKFSDVNRHYQMILAWLGFEVSTVDYEQGDRYEGKSSYNLYALAKLAVQGVFFQTTILLKLIVFLGFLVSLIGLAIASWATFQYFTRGALPGWTSLTVLILLVGGAILICQGVLGLYVGEIFDQVKQRPLFVISREYGVKTHNRGSGVGFDS
jgi:polyisoprenyl-phosphate glycosyltransferase